MKSRPPSSSRRRRLKVRRVAIDTYRENVAYLHRDCAVYRAEEFRALSKVEIRNGRRRILAVLNVVNDDAIVARDELGLSDPTFAQLGVAPGTAVDVGHPVRAVSMDAVRRKIAGQRLDQSAFDAIVADIATNRYSKPEIAAFIVATVQNELDRDEILFLTRAMVASGERLDWQESLVADKHCIGGIPGNRTSLLVVPIVAAHGLLIPKTSSRAITSPAGTADTMEVLADVELAIADLRRIVRRHRGCIAWGGTARLSPADDVMIAVERPLGIDSQGQLVASILSKKVAAGSTHLLIDIPVGPTAKVRHMRDAQHLRKLFEYVGDQLGVHLEVIITDGRQPIGNGIGPVLEARDAMRVLQGDPAAPVDLRQKALRLAGRIIEFDPDVRGGEGFTIARDILDSGRALAKMHAIMAAQGAPKRAYAPARLALDVTSPRAGVVTGIDNLQLARIARYAGAPAAKGAGVDLYRKLGDRVKAGQALYRVHAEFAADFRFARELCRQDTGYAIGAAADVPAVFAQA